MISSFEASSVCSSDTHQQLSVPIRNQSDTPFVSDPPSNSSPNSSNQQKTHSVSSLPLNFIQTRGETVSSSSPPPVRRKSLPLGASPTPIKILSGESLSANDAFPAPRPLGEVTSANLSRRFSDGVSLSLSLHVTNALPLHKLHRSTLPSDLRLSSVMPKQLSPIISSSKQRHVPDSVPDHVSGLANKWVWQTNLYAAPSSLAKSRPTSDFFTSQRVDTDCTGLNGPDEPQPGNLRPQSMSLRTATLSSLFSWGGNVTPALSPATSISDGSCTSPRMVGLDLHAGNRDKILAPLNIVKQPESKPDGYFGGQHFSTPLAPPTPSIQIEEMERELQEISSELAASIRREMELEDLVEQLQSQIRDNSCQERRTSDYFSDSGTSTSRLVGDLEPKQLDIERVINKDEHGRAQMRLELIRTVQEERAKRKELELHIKSLEEKASHVRTSDGVRIALTFFQVKFSLINSININERVQELENFCEDLRLFLAKGQGTKINSEDLTGLKAELKNSLNERDNLRYEVVPQLKARVEGLEAQAAVYEKLAYDQIVMHHEIHKLGGENLNLINTQNAQVEMKQLTKSLRLTETDSKIKLWSRSTIGAQVINSTSSHSTELETTALPKASETLAERLRGVELQRDSLHLALKGLLERQEHQNRENQKRINCLELELERAYSSSPRLLAYNKVVRQLKEEINALRIRADDAIRQKWQCEKSLSEIKMDLERTEQEVSTLRNLLLQERESFGRSETTFSKEIATLEPLEHSFLDLQSSYSESLEQIKKLEANVKDPETIDALRQLEQSLLNVISQRDSAAQGAKALLQQNKSILDSAKSLVSDQAILTEQLHDSAKRVEELSIQVKQQLTKNAKLRQRLAMTIAQGENEKEANYLKITSLQDQLRHLEKQLIIARKNSEERLLAHEEGIRDIEEGQANQILRIKGGIRSPLSLSHAKPSKSPRSFYFEETVADDAQVDRLRENIIELEEALLNADKQMEEVVSSLNSAQMQVMNLQNEREEAARETKKLQAMVESARAQATSGSWKAMLLL